MIEDDNEEYPREPDRCRREYTEDEDRIRTGHKKRKGPNYTMSGVSAQGHALPLKAVCILCK
jgi:hypothetical protein